MRLWLIRLYWRLARLWRETRLGHCERCRYPGVLFRTEALTHYVDDHGGWFCAGCRREYVEYWSEMWAEYYRSRN